MQFFYCNFDNFSLNSPVNTNESATRNNLAERQREASRRYRARHRIARNLNSNLQQAATNDELPMVNKCFK